MVQGFRCFLVLVLLVGGGCSRLPSTPSPPVLSLLLEPRSATFDLDQVPQGAVRFTAKVRNQGPDTVTLAHPAACLPPNFGAGQSWHLQDFHGKSEILLEVRRPDGSEAVLRDGYRGYFDPGNRPILTIPSGGTGSFEVGWFFLNARGGWERDDVAAGVFLQAGTYRVRLLFRNRFPGAAWHHGETGETRFERVWTGEMASPEVTIAID